jgi:hypothetical protein
MARKESLTQEFVRTANTLAGRRWNRSSFRKFKMHADGDEPEKIATVRAERSVTRTVEYSRLLIRDSEPTNPGEIIEVFPIQEIVYMAETKERPEYLSTESGVAKRELGHDEIRYRSGPRATAAAMEQLDIITLFEDRKPTEHELTEAFMNMRLYMAGLTRATESDLLELNERLAKIEPRRDELLPISLKQLEHNDSIARTRSERRAWEKTLPRRRW